MKTVNPEFRVHRLTEAGLKKADDIAAVFDEALTKLKALCPEGHHFALVKTKLEEASFFAKKSMAVDPANQAEG